MKLPSTLADHKLFDHHGRPVPYINVWSAEMPETTWKMRYDPNVARLAISAPKGLQGVGEPNFLKQEPCRQRACATRHLCQVCAHDAGPGALLAVGSLSAENVHVEQLGGAVTVITEPWLCPPCAAFALAVCPGLIRRQRNEDLVLVHPRRSTIIVSEAYLEGPDEQLHRQHRPVLWAKLAIQGLEHVAEVPA